MPSRRGFDKYRNPVLIESGSYNGDGIQDALTNGFDRVISFEVSASLHAACKRRFQGNPKVTLVHGSTNKCLPEYLQSIRDPITFWLDGHYSHVPECSFVGKPCPIIEELQVIMSFSSGRTKDVILIDDRRLMRPSAVLSDGMFSVRESDVVEILRKINPNFQISYIDGHVKDDIIVAAPL